MAFVVPCISIVVCYARIFYIVRKTALRSHDTGSMLGNSIHSNRTQNNNHGKKPYATNNNKNVSDGTDVQLLPKSDDISGDSSGRIDRIELPIFNQNENKTKINTTTATTTATITTTNINTNHTIAKNKMSLLSEKNILQSDNTSMILSHSQSHGNIKSALKFIDSTGGENDYPPTLSALRKNRCNDEQHKLSVSDRNLSNVSISRTVEFIEVNGERHNSCDRNYIVKTGNDAVDSAVEESTSSMENNQVSDTPIHSKMSVLFMNFIRFIFSKRYITLRAIIIAYKSFPFKLNHRPVLELIYHWIKIAHRGL